MPEWTEENHKKNSVTTGYARCRFERAPPEYKSLVLPLEPTCLTTAGGKTSCEQFLAIWISINCTNLLMKGTQFLRFIQSLQAHVGRWSPLAYCTYIPPYKLALMVITRNAITQYSKMRLDWRVSLLSCDQMLLDYNFSCCFVWVWIVIAHTEGGT